jgi:hypothetical protein
MTKETEERLNNLIVASASEQEGEVVEDEEEEEPEDKKEQFEAECAETAECKPVKNRLDACTERVLAAGDGHNETCVEVGGF